MALGEDTAFPPDVIEEGTRHLTPSLDLASAIDDQVDWHPKFSECMTQTYELGTATVDCRLDYNEVQVAIGACFPTRPRTEEDHPRIGSSLGESTASLRNQGLVSHEGHGSPSQRRFEDL